ncbi:MAG: hypothetical protein ACAI38_01465 [Myxococcota bacterium]|nr:hypothetical protein [Myxococcota bacterium]
MIWIVACAVLAVGEEPITQEPIAEEPTAEQPLADETGAEEPRVEEPPRFELREMENQRPGLRDESGFTLTVGVGPAFGGIGVSLGYTFEATQLVHLSPYVGGGFIGVEANDEAELWGGAAAGLLTSVGRRHRVVLDVIFGSTAVQYLRFHGYEMTRRSWGPTALIGYAFVTKNHFMVRGALGPSFIALPYSPEHDHWSLAAQLAVGKTF